MDYLTSDEFRVPVVTRILAQLDIEDLQNMRMTCKKAGWLIMLSFKYVIRPGANRSDPRFAFIWHVDPRSREWRWLIVASSPLGCRPSMVFTTPEDLRSPAYGHSEAIVYYAYIDQDRVVRQNRAIVTIDQDVVQLHADDSFLGSASRVPTELYGFWVNGINRNAKLFGLI